MKFINAQLLSGERVIQAIPFSKRGVFLEALLLSIPFIALLAAVIAVDMGYVGTEIIQQKVHQLTNGELKISPTTAKVLAGIAFALIVKIVTGNSLFELLLRSLFGFILIPHFVITRLIGHERALTNFRLLRKSGILRTDFQDHTVERLHKSTYQQSLLGKLFNFGDVIVTDARETQHILSLVNKPAEITRLLNTHAGRRSFTQAPTEEVLLPGDPISERLDGVIFTSPKIIGDE